MDTKQQMDANTSRIGASAATSSTKAIPISNTTSVTASSSNNNCTQNSTANEGSSWWRWSHGKSGSISSSSDGIVQSGTLTEETAAPKMSSPPSDGLKWQKRASRSFFSLKEESSFNISMRSSFINTSASSVSTATSPPSFFGSSNDFESARTLPTKKKSPLLQSVKDSKDVKKKVPLSSPNTTASSIFVPLKLDGKMDHTELKWTMGSCARKLNRRERRGSRLNITSSSKKTMFSSRIVQHHNVHNENEHCDTEEKQSVLSSENKAGVSKKEECVNVRVIKQTEKVEDSSDRKKDPVVNHARAVLQDCIRQRHIEQSNARKRNIEAVSSCNLGAQKASDCAIFNWCSSSSSDDELSQLSSLEPAAVKLTDQKDYRQLMRHDSDYGSSPDLDSYECFFEEKGLPVEIRYQLPLALGTPNETNKECTICQLHYNIGDHIVTLPCQHFFHACCVDKWLWNHTSCPLCRTEVSLDKVPSTTHNFTECSQIDQENLRRKLRSSSQSAGFRPVVPANSEVDQLQNQLASLNIDEECAEPVQFKYLICPIPQRKTVKLNPK